MSWQALADAAKYPAASAAEKLMLLAYADRHNEETGSAYPSIDWLCQFSSLNRKTVISAIAKLEAAGVLTDTGERMGRTKQIKVYRLNLEQSQKRAASTVPKTEQSRKRNSTDFSRKESRKRDTDTVREPVGSEPKGSSPRAWSLPVGVSLQVWTDFLTNRKRKRLPNTDTAWKAFNDDLHRVSSQTGIPPPKLIERCAAKGWGAIYDPRDNRYERTDNNPTASAVHRVLASQQPHG